ncbi:MAG: hypothetical protein ACRC18_07260 [Cetobacterium sp.]
MYFDFIEKNHLRTIKLDDNLKNKYYSDLNNISESWTGRADALFTNTFILESIHLVVNAISLFESGYFDCAYYSLRQSLEVSTTMNYLLELTPETRKKKFTDWKTQQDFPMDGQMLAFLKNNKDIYYEMFNNMNEYFSKLKETKKKLNKFVHKQGYQYLYTTRNQSLNKKYNDGYYLEEFIEYLKTCIGAIAVFRLGIDPMPILLMDEEIYYRISDHMTRAFNEDFIEEYIGLEHINNYKKTEIYLSHYECIIKEEKLEEYVKAVTQDNYIDKNMITKILKQKHLLSKQEYLGVAICGIIEKISKIYTFGGLCMYFTNLQTVRKKMSWNSKFFSDLEGEENPINCSFDEAYISYFKFEEDLDIFLEHNEILTEIEIETIKNIKNNI